MVGNPGDGRSLCCTFVSTLLIDWKAKEQTFGQPVTRSIFMPVSAVGELTSPQLH